MTMTQQDSLVGRSLPHLKLASTEGRTVELPQDLLGRWTLLYFYPKDDTPGCTQQACSYRDNIASFRKLGVQVLGVSLDDLSSHDGFIQKFSLNFPLLADTQHELSAALGVYGEQEWKGQKFQGLSRDTFLIDPQGKIRDVWRKVSPATTMQETFDRVSSRISGA
jgi:peroxiredoxin Q/BCP